MGTSKLLPEHIASEQSVVHPALDWRDDILLMGVKLGDGGRAVLTSHKEILGLTQLAWPICDQAQQFARSPVTEDMARRFQEGYGTPGNSESAYALVDVAGRLAAYYRRFVVFSETWWPDVLALWTLGTYLYPIFSAYPYLRISSPEPGCGKSLLGQIIARLSFNGELLASPTEANIFRMAEAERGTQVWDEVENEHNIEQSRLQAMKAALLNGYRSGGVVPRQERKGRGQFMTVYFHVYVPRALIGLSGLPAVVQQRVIELTLHRSRPGELAERYRPDEREQEEIALREVCALYALTYCHGTSLRYRTSKVPDFLERRFGQAGRLIDDLLQPLIAVASGPLDSDERSQSIIKPRLRVLMEQIIPALAKSWNEAATTTPAWFAAALDVLEEEGALEPAELAKRVSQRTGVPMSPEQLSHGLKKYGIQSEKSGGRRVFSMTVEQIDKYRAQYHLEEAVTPRLAPSVAPDGQ